MPVALITGVRGQDGSYLAELLRTRGFDVHGLVQPGDGRAPDPGSATLHEVDLTDTAGVAALVAELSPDHLYNLAGLSSVALSWEDPLLTTRVNALGAQALLEAATRLAEAGKDVRFVQASSAEMFGQPSRTPQDEGTAIAPVSPYGASKAFAHLLVGVQRGRGLHASSVILYNHESPRRPPHFVTRKITATVAAIAQGRAEELRLGNLDARRDWGWAPDYVRAMFLAASHPTGDDYVLATGEAHSVRDFVSAAFARVGMTDWADRVVVDPAFFRPVDPFELVGDATKARTQLGWSPSVGFNELVARMVEADLERA